jgi:hypothetical protein
MRLRVCQNDQVRLFRRRITQPVHADAAVPPTYATLDDFIGHALRYPENGWYERLFGAYESVGTVDRCLQLNSQAVASMPLRYRHSPDVAGYEPAWIHDPDPAWYPNGIGDATFAAVWSIYAHGDAFFWVTSRYEATGYPRTWTILDPVTMKVAQGHGTRRYESNGYPLDVRDVVQVSRNPNGALRGTSALEAYAGNVRSAYAAEIYAADAYFSTGVSRVALQSKQRLSADQAADLQAQWVAAVQRRMGAPAILPPDITMLNPMSVAPRDMMLLETRDWDARQIAAAFGVPAMLLNIAVSGGLTYQNPEQLFGLWWRSELMPCALKIGAALSRWLPRGHWVEFDPSVAIRPDLQQQIDIYSRALADQVITVDEYRAAVFDLPPLVEGEPDEALTFYEEAGAHGAEGAPPTVEEVLVA